MLLTVNVVNCYFSATKHHHATEQLTKTDLQHYYAKHEPAKAREVLGDVVGAWETKTLAKQLEKQFGESPLAFAMERSLLMALLVMVAMLMVVMMLLMAMMHMMLILMIMMMEASARRWDIRSAV